MTWLDFKIISNKNDKIEIIGCIDMNTIDDDECDVEYMQQDGTMANHLPHRYKINNQSFEYEFGELAYHSIVTEWDIISQILAEYDYTNDTETYTREFKEFTLVINYK